MLANGNMIDMEGTRVSTSVQWLPMQSNVIKCVYPFAQKQCGVAYQTLPLMEITVLIDFWVLFSFSNFKFAKFIAGLLLEPRLTYFFVVG
ncbi:hypothetical protein Gohar_015057 [Gossypium harknessii]|uniref:Uncharacterized protein n=1 Tax=Gossypium harknessii TaxID=34285 RepID=A0A7J9FZ23_9ROSI|nr:hypothetical protein [Gossypium harknessii]